MPRHRLAIHGVGFSFGNLVTSPSVCSGTLDRDRTADYRTADYRTADYRATDLLTASRIGIFSGGRSALMIGMNTARVECARVLNHRISVHLRQQEFDAARACVSELFLTHQFGEMPRGKTWGPVLRGFLV